MKAKNAYKDPFGFDMFKDLDKYFVGLDDHLQKMHQMHQEFAKAVPGYPPYNIRKVADNKYQIELAVAGFGKQDIDIELADNKLVIKGNVATEQDTENNFLFRGIGMRAFTRTFAIDDHVEVQSAEIVNGMLKVFLEKLVPETKKPKKIKVKEHDYTQEV
jgi:molecular chaperone IbpA